ncbi:MAG: CGNR zinc finger domain-containing protein [Chloroflexota bacterium]|nr:CGNR zinc finger domain-containing protein [Chloroflexota bacterium]
MQACELLTKSYEDHTPEQITALLNLPSVRLGLATSSEEVRDLCPGCDADGLAALGTLGGILRAALRGDIGQADLQRELNEMLSSCPVTITLNDSGLDLAPLLSTDAGKLPALRLALGVAASLHSGEWARIKQCAGCDCVFHDSSRNGKRVWCSMETCGNRAKVNRWRGRNAVSNTTEAAGCACGENCTCGALEANKQTDTAGERT